MQDQNPRAIVAIGAASNIGTDGKQWIDILPTAEKTRNGPWYFTTTREDLDVYAAYIEANPDRIQVDYDHASGGSSVAAGWFTGGARVEDRDGEAVLQAEVEWTPQALDEIKAKRFRFISPEWTYKKKDPKTGLMTKAKEILAATLTNRPFFKQLVPVASELLDSENVDRVAAALGSPVAQLILAAQETADPQLLEAVASVLAALPAHEGDEMPDLKVIATALGLDENADEDTITAELKKTNDAKAALAAEVEDLKAKAAEAAEAKSETEKLRAEVDDLKATAETTAKKQLVAQAIRDRQADPVQEEWLLAQTVEQLEKYVEVTPKAKFEAKGSGGDTKDAPKGDAKEFETDGDYPVAEDGLALHAKAEEILAAEGKPKGKYSEDDYVRAIEQAARDLVAA